MTSRTQTTFAPPVMQARRWLQDATFPENRPLINVSQAAPIDPPPAPLRAAMADALEQPETHLYGPVLGLPACARNSRRSGRRITVARSTPTGWRSPRAATRPSRR